MSVRSILSLYFVHGFCKTHICLICCLLSNSKCSPHCLLTRVRLWTFGKNTRLLPNLCCMPQRPAPPGHLRQGEPPRKYSVTWKVLLSGQLTNLQHTVQEPQMPPSQGISINPTICLPLHFFGDLPILELPFSWLMVGIPLYLFFCMSCSNCISWWSLVKLKPSTSSLFLYHQAECQPVLDKRLWL